MMIDSQVHEYYMALALRLAKKGLYTTSPNPRVGCVLVKDGEIVGKGWHKRAGQGHAEVNALADAGEHAKGSTAYVTLEPCSHHGRTPPCCEALVKAGVVELVSAMQDPNPEVAGRGHAYLEDQGLKVTTGIMQSEAEQLNQGFIKRMITGLPWVRVKLAASLDGRTAMASGESVWITGPEARKDVQLLRAQSSCVLTGSGTVLFDDPSMNVRLDANELGIEGDVCQPIRAIVDGKAQVPATAKIYQLGGKVITYSTKPLILNDSQINADVEVVCQDEEQAMVDLHEMLLDLGKRGVNEVHVEAGSVLCGALLSQSLVDELVLYSAMTIMGDSGKGLFHLPMLERMADRIKLTLKDVRQVGQDMRLTLHIKPNSA